MSSPPDRTPALAAIPPAARGFQGRRAGIVSRAIASFIDALVVIAIMGLIYGVVVGFVFLLHPRSFHLPDGSAWSIPVVSFGIAVPYLTIGWRTSGRTYGDVLLGLRVVNRAGARMRLIVALLRAIAYVLFPIGLFWVAISPANRSVQDVIFRTSVIYDWSERTQPPTRPGGSQAQPGPGLASSPAG